jgi:hypothetical protein
LCETDTCFHFTDGKFHQVGQYKEFRFATNSVNGSI